MQFVQLIKKITPQKLIEWRRLRDSKEYQIIKNPDAVFPIVYHIKDESWETVNKPEVYHIAKASKQTLFHPSQNILEVKNGIVRGGADYVLIGNECIWDKAYQDIFSITIPQDRRLMTYDRNKMRIRNIKEIRQIDGAILSLLGVFSNIWSHFLMQFLCKLYYAEEAGLLDEPITILMPDYRDDNIKELVNDVISRHDNVKTMIDKGDVGYQCEKLYYIETTSIVANHGDYIIPIAEVVPQKVKEKLYKNIVEPRIEIIQKTNNSNARSSKIYLVRRDTYRKIVNYEEVEQYFIKNGFVLIEPHKYTLREKAELFHSADIIAGPMSSAWSNILFCKKEAKGLCLTPICRTEELFIGYHADISGMQCMFVTGDDTSTTIHSDYKISIEQIDAAYKHLSEE